MAVHRTALCLLGIAFAVASTPGPALAEGGVGWMNEAPRVTGTAPRAAVRSEAATLSEPTAGFTVTPTQREDARVFYKTVYTSSENVPMGWTGSVVNGQAGTTSPDFRDAVLRRINYFRAMAGVPAGVTENTTYSAKDQLAALMMSANNALSHTPPASWLYYTPEGAEAAGKSSLFLGRFGPSAVTGYIEDYGSGNALLGHRRWLLYPQTKQMGTGDIPPDGSYKSANAIWVITSDYGSTRPAVRDDFVAWPPKGYVPYSVLFPRWSLSYPNADFSTATVTMQRGGSSVPVRIESSSATGYGENTLVWVPDDLNSNNPAVLTPPASDTPIDVTVSGVKVSSQTRSFSYTVTVFDPSKPGADTVEPVVSGSTQPQIGVASAYSCAAVPRASGYQWRTALKQPFTAVEGAEDGTANVSVDAPGMNVVSTAYAASGGKSFHLATPDFGSESITLLRTLVPSAASTLKFSSRFGYATSSQVAAAQVSTDDGATWATVYSEAGTGAPASGFNLRQVSLAAYAGHSIEIRFVFAYAGPGSAYTQTSENIGWYFDDVSLIGAAELTSSQLGAVSANTSFTFTPAETREYALQARAQFYGEYPFEWGPVFTATGSVPAPPQITKQPVSITVVADQPASFSVEATGAALHYQWFNATGPIPQETQATFTIAAAQPGDTGSYYVEVSNSAGTVPSDVVQLTVTIPDPVVTTGAAVASSDSVLELNGAVDVHGQTVACGFEYGLIPGVFLEIASSSHAQPASFTASLTGLAADTLYYFRGFAETTGGTRYYGATQSIRTLRLPAVLSVAVSPPGSGSITGTPGGVLRVGDPVALTAKPAKDFIFANWSGSFSSNTPTLEFIMDLEVSVTANFIPSPVPRGAGTYVGLALSTPAAHESCGLVRVTANSRGAFTGKAVMGGRTTAFRSVFAADGQAPEVIASRGRGLSPLHVALRLDAGASPPEQIVGQLRTEAFTAELTAARVFFTARRNPKPPRANPPSDWVGPVTGVIETASLAGHGWATGALTKAGALRLSGALADGTKWSSSAPLTPAGKAPLFALLHGKRGSLFGSVALTAGSPLTLAGENAHWFRPQGIGSGPYAAGWPEGVAADFRGSAWAPPRRGIVWEPAGFALANGFASLTASGASLTAPLTWDAAFASATRRVTVTPEAGLSATLKLVPGTGAFTGKFRPALTGAAQKFSGVLLPSENQGLGFFLDSTGSGEVVIAPR